MEQNKFPLKFFTALALVTSITVFSCNNNDTNDATVTTDNTTTTMSDTAATMPMSTDTTAMMPPATDATAMASTTTSSTTGSGMAKPNPAKKGMKGKVSISMPAAPTVKAEVKADASGVYTGVDYIPSFPGGTAGLQKFFNDNIQYPRDAAAEGVEGNVRVGFTVDENGKLMNPMVEGVKSGYGLDEEAIRVIKKMPVWTPGKVNGKAVKTKFVLPVQFALSNQ
ncbi:MAG: energy transducer TonB [Ferruginibacter sp.]